VSAADNTMRAEFEAWVRSVHDHYDYAELFRPSSSGLYYDEDRIEEQWQAWKAARAGTASMVADAVAAEREACLQACREVLRRQVEDEGSDAAGDCCDAIRARSTTPEAGEQR